MVGYNCSMVKLSVAMATFNEGENLARTLESVRELADEIVIYDGESTDKTVEIAKSFGAKVITGKNYPIFHVNKQKAIDACTGDWILQLDADEVVSEVLASEIKNQISKSKNEFDGFWIPRKNWFLGRFLMKGGQYPDYTLRLYRKGKGRLPQKDVHEQAEVDGKVGYLKNALLHYPYKDFATYIKKWGRYNNLISTQIKEELKDKNSVAKAAYGFGYLLIKPAHWLLTTYGRHKGFMDSWQGFTFSLFSALRFPVSYIKYIGYYNFAIILIILLSIFLRFYNFQARWGIAGDDARDALIALEALKRGELPLTGSFSSAGPFVFGGIFYWLIMASYFPLHYIWSPWFITALTGVFTVLVFLYIGKEIAGKSLAIMMGFFAATAPQLVARSLILGQHTFISTFAALTVLCLLLLWRTKKVIFAFLTGVSLGLAVNFHYQAINLLILIPAVLFIPLKTKARILAFVLVSIGFLIPMLPLLYWDSFQEFANLRNIADYFLIAQYRIYVPNSWRLFVFEYLPSYWSIVIGTSNFLAVVNIILGFTLFVYSLVWRQISGKVAFFGMIFLALLFLNRYYRGERSESYLLYLIPFILILTAWFVDKLIAGKNKLLKCVGLIFLVVFLSGNMVGLIDTMNYESPVGKFRQALNVLYKAYPDSKFALYDYKYRQYSASMPISLMMNFDGKAEINGKKIGISCYGKECPQDPKIVTGNPIFLVVDLDGEGDLDEKTWVNVNKESVYDDSIGWLNKHQLKSTFSFQDYIFKK